MPRITLRERFFQLHEAADVDQFLAGFPWCVVFKAGTSEKTFDAWTAAQNALEPRPDVAVGFIRLPEDRNASDRVSAYAATRPTATPMTAYRTPSLIACRTICQPLAPNASRTPNSFDRRLVE